MAVRDGKGWISDPARLTPYDGYGIDEGIEEEYHDGEEEEDYGEYEGDELGDDDGKTGLACPFCLEDFDVLGLCCHIDVDHHREIKAAICPVCVIKVESNIVGHLINQHEAILKMLCKKSIRKGAFRSALSVLKKDFQEGNRSHLKGSSSSDSSSNKENDALLLSFVNNPQPLQKPEITRPSSEASLLSNNSDIETVESGRDIKICALSNKDQEKIQRCEFVHGLLLSTIFDDL